MKKIFNYNGILSYSWNRNDIENTKTVLQREVY